MEPIIQCDRCGRKLKDKKSLDRGYGPVCYKKELEEGMEYTSETAETDGVS